MGSQSNAIVPDNSAAPASTTRDCESHGAYVAKHLFGRHWTSCPTCEQEAEQQRAAAAEERRGKEQEAHAKAMLEFNLRNCGLTGRYLRPTFDNFTATTGKQRDVVDVVHTFAKTFTSTSGGGLWLIGSPGTGKTHLGASAVSHAIRERGMSACMHSLQEIQTMLRARWTSSKDPVGYWAELDGLDTTDKLLEHLGTVQLLVLDELGVGRGTDAELETLFQIVDRRYQLERPTVVLSNLAPPALKVAMGDRVYDRLREGTRMVVLDWPSHRGATK